MGFNGDLLVSFMMLRGLTIWYIAIEHGEIVEHGVDKKWWVYVANCKRLSQGMACKMARNK